MRRLRARGNIQRLPNGAHRRRVGGRKRLFVLLLPALRGKAAEKNAESVKLPDGWQQLKIESL